MAKTIDNRVVQMEFDNKTFEKNMNTTLDSLGKLNDKLKLENAAKGFKDISKEASNVKLDGINSAIETISNRFTTMGVVGMTTLVNISNAAVNAGKKIVSALTIDPLKSGFQEYTTQINAIQTILANTSGKGGTITTVSKALDELNLYADKTIYNFTEMTRNIGTFTAAGIDLDKSVAAIKGIANLAAVSGSTSQQASTAMYQISQALAADQIRLMDWNSIVNAGMGGQVFQDSLKETARVHGIAIDDIIAKEGSFRNSLSQEWLSAEIMTETLAKFTGDLSKEQLLNKGYTKEQAEEIYKLSQTANDAATKVKTLDQMWSTLKETSQSGWAKTWQLIVGDFDEAKDLFTGINNVLNGVIESSSTSRNEMLKSWKDMGGRTKLIEGFSNIFEGIFRVVNSIGSAFREFFPKATADNVYKLTEKFADLTKVFKLSDGVIGDLKNTFRGLFSILSVITDVFKALVGLSLKIGSLFLPLIGNVLQLTGGLGLLIADTVKVIKSGEGLQKVFGEIYSIISPIISSITNFVDNLFNLSTNLKDSTNKVDAFGNKIEEKMKPAISFGESIGRVLTNIGNFVVIIFKEIYEWGSKVFDVVGDVFNKLSESPKNDQNGSIMSLGSGLSFAGIILVIKKISDFLGNINKLNFENGIFGTLFGDTGSIGKMSESITSLLDGVGESLNALTLKVKSDALKNIAISIAILTAGLFVLSTIDSKKLDESLASMAIVFVELAAVSKIFSSTIKSISIKDMIATTILLNGVATAVLILSVAISKLGKLSWDEIAKGLTAVTASMALFIITSKTINTDSKGMIKSATSMIILGVALQEISKAVFLFAKMDWDSNIRGLTALGIALAEVIVAVNLIPKISLISMAGLVVFAEGLTIIAQAVSKFSSINSESASSGLKVMAISLAEIVIAFNTLPKSTILKATGVLILANAIGVVATSLQKLSSIFYEDAIRGLKVMAISLAEIVIAFNTLPKSTILKATGILILANALLTVADVVSKMSIMSWNEVAKGLTVLGGSLLILAIGMNAMTKTISGSSSMLIMAAALSLFVPVLKQLSTMSWEEITKSLIALAGGFAVVGAAGVLLSGTVPTILALSSALLILGVAALSVGAGVALLGVGLGTLAVSGGAGLAVFISYMQSMIELVPIFMYNLGAGLGEFFKGLAKMSDDLSESITIIIQAFIKAVVKATPDVVDGILQLIENVFAQLIKHLPVLVGQLADMIIILFDSLALHAPRIIKSLFNFFIELFKGAFDAFKDVDIDVLLKGTVALSIITGLAFALSALVSALPLAMVGVLGLGVLIAEFALVLAAIGALDKIPGFQQLIGSGGNILGKIGEAIGKFIGGVAGGFIENASAGLPALGSNLSLFMENLKPFLDGASLIDPGVMAGVGSLGVAILSLTAADVIEGLTSWFTGGSSFSEFGKDLAEFGPYFKQFADSVAGVDGSVVSNSAAAALSLAEFANKIPNAGGIAGWFMGENDIDIWGSKLPLFGYYLTEYSKSVVGVDSGVIKSSSEAALALSELSKNLPNAGGLVAWFAGENNIDEWGSRLPSFGGYIKSYSDSVIGINGDAITNSAIASGALSELSRSLPNAGGLAAWFMGENNIDQWGTMLPSFGSNIKAYAASVSGIDESAISSSANASKALAELANNLPNSGGIFEWFTGSNNISDFGKNLGVFGGYLSEYYTSIKAIEFSKLIQASNSISELVALAINITNIDSGSIVLFGEALKKMAELGIQSFIDSFNSDISKTNVTGAILGLIETARSSVETNSATFVDYGRTVAVSFTKGISDQFSTAKTNGGALVNSLIDGINTKKEDIKTLGNMTVTNFIGGIGNIFESVRNKGVEIITNFINGISSKKEDVKNLGATIALKFIEGISSKNIDSKVAGENLLTFAKNGLSDTSNYFYNTGVNTAQGFINGMASKTKDVGVTADSLGNRAIQYLSSAVKTRSPSRETLWIGEMTGLGFINGIKSMLPEAANISSMLGSTSIDSVNDILKKSLDVLSMDETNPTISPVVDLSNINSSIGTINGIYSQVGGLSANLAGSLSVSTSNDSENFVLNRLNELLDKLNLKLDEESETEYTINSTIVADGREIAKATAKYTKEEITALQLIEARKAGLK